MLQALTRVGNETYGGTLSEEEIAAMQAEVASCVSSLLDALRIKRDHNTADTAARVAKMFVREAFAGRYTPAPVLTDFPNVNGLDQIYTVGPIDVRSCCAHHLLPIMGSAWIGVIPSKRLIGLSKFHRLTHWIMSRPQIQEEATQQLADALTEALDPIALGVVVRAKHFCTAWRGVKDTPSVMVTSIVRGLFKEDQRARAEFMALIAGMGFRQ